MENFGAKGIAHIADSNYLKKNPATVACCKVVVGCSCGGEILHNICYVRIAETLLTVLFLCQSGSQTQRETSYEECSKCGGGLRKGNLRGQCTVGSSRGQ